MEPPRNVDVMAATVQGTGPPAPLPPPLPPPKKSSAATYLLLGGAGLVLAAGVIVAGVAVLGKPAARAPADAGVVVLAPDDATPEPSVTASALVTADPSTAPPTPTRASTPARAPTVGPPTPSLAVSTPTLTPEVPDASLAPVASTAAPVVTPHPPSGNALQPAADLMSQGDLAGARALLEPRVMGHIATPDEVKLLRLICKKQGDKTCLAAIKKL